MVLTEDFLLDVPTVIRYSHNPELDFKMNILQLVKVQIVKGIKHLMATAAQICHKNQNPNTYSDPQQDEYCDEEEKQF